MTPTEKSGASFKIRQRSYSMPSRASVSGAGGGAPTLTAQREPHEPSVIWLTGLSGAGKSKVALALYQEMLRRDVPAQCLDGDAGDTLDLSQHGPEIYDVLPLSRECIN